MHKMLTAKKESAMTGKQELESAIRAEREAEERLAASRRCVNELIGLVPDK